MSTVKLLKLTTGEEVLCTVTEEDKNFIHIKDAVVVFIGGTQDNSMSLQFAPWTLTMFSEDDVAKMSRSGVLAECSANTEILDRYNKMFGNVSIAVPEKKIILS